MDREQEILAQVRAALAGNAPAWFRGGGSKSFLAGPYEGEPVDLAGHEGVVDYDPGELVITCRAGSRLEDIRALLAENGQHLPFEPPSLGEGATVGGAVACGLSGPARPWAGSLRDYLLGVRVVNGRGKALSFGGRVMKNVAGYDISRLMAGSRGTLGAILELSFKVLPLPARECTLAFECGQGEAIRRVADWSATPLPLSAAAWQDGRLLARLSGAAGETGKAAAQLGGDSIPDGDDYWRRLRELKLAFFERDDPLWRFSLPANAQPIGLSGEFLLDWGGAQRWYFGPETADEIFAAAEAAGGQARLFRGEAGGPRSSPQPPAMRALQERIRLAFDPQGLFNRPRAAEGA